MFKDLTVRRSRLNPPPQIRAHLKTSIIEIKAEKNCLAHALIIAIAKLTNDPNYKAYCQGRKIQPVVDKLLETTGINRDSGAGSPQLIRFQDSFPQYKIVVYVGLNCDSIMFEGQVETSFIAATSSSVKTTVSAL
jgi:hypothetical protein